MSIDTIIIKIQFNLPGIGINMDYFDFKHPETLPGFRKSCRTKYPEEKAAHFPTVTIMKDNHGNPEIALEFSCGKFLQGNNIETLNKQDFNLLIDKLHNDLIKMDIFIPKVYLKEARVSRLDASMVIDLSNYSSCSTIQQTLSKIAYPQNIKAKKIRFPQPEFDGEQFVLTNKGETKEWRLSIYDKKAEALSSKANKDTKVLVDINGQMVEKTIKEAFDLTNTKQLLRIELQCLTPKEIRKHLKKQGLDIKDLTFEALFDEQIACNMILDVWEQYITPHLSSGLMQRMNEHSLKDKALKRGISYPEIMQMLYYKHSCSLYKNGINDIKKEFSDENLRPYIIKAERTFNKIPTTDKTSVARTFKYIHKCIKEAIPFKFKV